MMRSPRLEARITGVFYLFNLLTGVAAILLIGHKQKSAGDMMNVVASVLYTVVTLLLWHLLRPVSAWVSGVAAVVSLLGCWLPLTRYEDAYPPLHITDFTFFGIYCLLIAYLIFRSRFMPNPVGALMTCAGVCWLTTFIAEADTRFGTNSAGSRASRRGNPDRLPDLVWPE